MKKSSLLVAALVSAMFFISACSADKKNNDAVVSAPSASRAKMVDSVKTTPSLSEDEKKAMLVKIANITNPDEVKCIWLDNVGDISLAAHEKWVELMKQRIATIKNPDEVKRIWLDNVGDISLAAYEKYKQLGGK